MELRHLRYFVTVAEEGHITRAAERLGIAQPPLSRQIKEIERELDVQLFFRRARGVELTDAGRIFLDDARAMLDRLKHAYDATKRASRGEQGQLSIGFTSAATFHPLVPRVIREFRSKFPLVSVLPADGFPNDLIERLNNEQIDVVFIRTPIANTKDIIMDQLLEEDVVVGLPRNHPLARGKRAGNAALSLSSLSDETFIFYGYPNGPLSAQSNALVAACQNAGFNPRIGHVIPDMLSRINLVAAGLGIAVVSASMQRMKVEGVVYRRLNGATTLKAPLIVASRRKDRSVVLRQFLKLTKQTAHS